MFLTSVIEFSLLNVTGSRINSNILSTLNKDTYAKSASSLVGPKNITLFVIVNH